MSDWSALRKQLRRDYRVVREDPDRLLLDYGAAHRTWYLRGGRKRDGAPGLELAVLVCSSAGVTAPALSTANENIGGKLSIAKDHVLLGDTIPSADLEYAELRRIIADLVAQAGRVARALRPHD